MFFTAESETDIEPMSSSVYFRFMFPRFLFKKKKIENRLSRIRFLVGTFLFLRISNRPLFYGFSDENERSEESNNFYDQLLLNDK